MAGVICQLPNEPPRYVPISLEKLPLEDAAAVSGAMRCILREAFSFGDEDDGSFRVLFRERDLDDESQAVAFLEALASGGAPVFLRVVFRLLGGKGGFGALLKKQAAGGKKTTNFDSMRDLSGRRVRHSKAVERIKEWMEKQKREDELVNLITGEGPELPKPVAKSETLDPEYVRRLKRGAADKAAAVGEGMRRAFEADADSSVGMGCQGLDAGVAAKRVRTMTGDDAGAAAASSSSSGARLGAFDALDGLSSPSSSCAASDEEAAATASPERRGSRCAEAEPMPPQSSGGGHTAGLGGIVGGAAAAAPRDSWRLPVFSAALAAPAVGTMAAVNEASSPSSPRVERDGADAAQHDNASDKRASIAAGANGAAASAAAEEPLVTAADVARYASVAALEAKVSAEALKRSLQALGLKCGGTPRQRAERLFLLKDTALEDLPKSVMLPSK